MVRVVRAALPGIGRQNSATLFAYILLGIFAGVAVNRLNEFMESRAPGAYRRAWTALPMKMIPIVLVMGITQAVSPAFASDWQGTTPGLALVTFFFAMQTSLSADVARFA